MTTAFPVEEGHALAFSRAVGVAAPTHGQVVPPTFTTCSIQHDPDHMRDLRPTGALAAFEPGSGRVLHAEQRFEFFKQVRVGDVLDVAERVGRTWTRTSRTEDELEFRELVKEIRDGDGTLAVRSTMTLVRTGPES